MARKRILWIGCAVLALATGATAAAQPVPDADAVAKAEEAFIRGKALAKNKDLPGAYGAYIEAWKYRQTHDIAANLGGAELDLGKYRDAAEHLAFSARTAPPSATQQQREFVDELLKKAKAEVGTVHVELDLEAASVLVDGASASVLPGSQDVFVVPGSHTVTAALKGYTASEERVDAVKGRGQKVHVTLTPVAASSPAPSGSALPIAPPPKGEEQERALWPIGVGVGVTTVFLAGGIIFTVMSSGKGADAAAPQAAIDASGKRCGAGADAATCAELKSTLSSKDNLHNAAVAGFVGAGIAAIATPIVYLLWPKQQSKSTTGFVGVPIVGSQSAGVGVSGRF